MKRSPLIVVVHLLFALAALSLVCREPDSEVPADERIRRHFILFGGEGGGLGNLLIFFPSVYYFAAMTGREIVIIDKSLLGEICRVIICGYPLLSTMQDAYPEIFTEESMKGLRGLKAWDFRRHVDGDALENAPLVRGDGFKYASEWWVEAANDTAKDCVKKVTGCQVDNDIACGDRHALQSLFVGPFRSRFTEEEERRITGVPRHIKHGILALRHSLSPRFEVAVHLRTQFKHFEWLVGPNDGNLWAAAQKELYDWLNSTDSDKGVALFQLITDKLVEVVKADLLARYSSIKGPMSTSTNTASPPPSYSPTTTSTMLSSQKSNNEPDYKAMYEETQRKIAILKSTSEKPSTVDYKALYENTRKKIDQLKTSSSNSGSSGSSKEPNQDYKALYEETIKRIEEVKANKAATNSSVPGASTGIFQSLVDKVLGVRNKMFGPGQKVMYPPIDVSISDKPTSASPVSISTPATPSTSLVTEVNNKGSDGFQELNFDLEPYSNVSPYKLGTLLYAKQHSRRRHLRGVNCEVNCVLQPLYVYVSSDNSVVKEAFCKYLYQQALTFDVKSEDGQELHFRLQTMRVVNEGNYIAHGKNIANLKGVTNNTGIVDLAMDWYSISLANHILSWRRDTDLISTFAQSAQRLSGNTESSTLSPSDPGYHGIGHGKGSRGYNLDFKRGRPHWREYW